MSSKVYQFKPFNVGRVVVWTLFALVLLTAPLLFTSSLSQTMLSQMGIAIIVCLSYNILLGQGGMLSFGHAVYSGMGSFLAIHTLNQVSGGWPLPVSLVPIAGGLASMAVAILLGWVTTNLANGILKVVATVNLNPTNITVTVSGNTLTLTWPADHLGWTLLTNSVGLTATSSWFPVAGSASVTNEVITIDPGKTNVFYRMVYPYP